MVNVPEKLLHINLAIRDLEDFGRFHAGEDPLPRLQAVVHLGKLLRELRAPGEPGQKEENAMTLEERVAEAVARLAHTSYIEGWGLGVSDDLPGTVIVSGPAEGCFSETCAHNSHDPGAPTYRWIPPLESTLIRIGDEQTGDHRFNEYYVLRQNGLADLWLCHHGRGYYHDGLGCCEPEEVSDYLLDDLLKTP